MSWLGRGCTFILGLACTPLCVCVWLCATQPLLITAPGFGCWGPELPARSTAWGMGSGHLPGTSRGSTRLLALRELQVDVGKQ